MAGLQKKHLHRNFHTEQWYPKYKDRHHSQKNINEIRVRKTKPSSTYCKIFPMITTTVLFKWEGPVPDIPNMFPSKYVQVVH